MPPWYVNVIGVGIIIVITLIIFLIMHKRLLSLWKEVSITEVSFYRQLDKTRKEILKLKQTYETPNNREQFIILKQNKSKRVRSLLLQTRQDIYESTVIIYTDLEEQGIINDTLKQMFEKLQSTRRIFNSRVLLYNQTINIFPTRYLAVKMHLKTKEYFG